MRRLLGRILRHRPSPAMVVAFVALFSAGAPSATAAKLLTGKNIADDSLTGADIKDDSLSARDFGGAVPRGLRPRPGSGARRSP